MRTRKKRKTGVKRSFFLPLFLCGIGLALHAQISTPVAPPADDNASHAVSTRSILGHVVSKAGTAIPGAVVLLKDGKTLQVRSYITQQAGEYHFYGLSTDVNYTLRAQDKTMTSKVKTVSVFDSHKQVKLDLKLVKKIEPLK